MSNFCHCFPYLSFTFTQFVFVSLFVSLLGLLLPTPESEKYGAGGGEWNIMKLFISFRKAVGEFTVIFGNFISVTVNQLNSWIGSLFLNVGGVQVRKRRLMSWMCWHKKSWNITLLYFYFSEWIAFMRRFSILAESAIQTQIHTLMAVALPRKGLACWFTSQM